MNKKEEQTTDLEKPIEIDFGPIEVVYKGKRKLKYFCLKGMALGSDHKTPFEITITGPMAKLEDFREKVHFLKLEFTRIDLEDPKIKKVLERVEKAEEPNATKQRSPKVSTPNFNPSLHRMIQINPHVEIEKGAHYLLSFTADPTLLVGEKDKWMPGESLGKGQTAVPSMTVYSGNPRLSRGREADGTVSAIVTGYASPDSDESKYDISGDWYIT